MSERERKGQENGEPAERPDDRAGAGERGRDADDAREGRSLPRGTDEVAPDAEDERRLDLRME